MAPRGLQAARGPWRFLALVVILQLVNPVGAADDSQRGAAGSASQPAAATSTAGGRSAGGRAAGQFHFTLAENPVKIDYSRKGVKVESRSGNYEATIRGRVQLRFSHPLDHDPRKESHFSIQQSRFRFRRARLKAEGHAVRPWLTFKFEHDLVDNHLLNLRVTFKKYEWLQFRAGQWELEYNRERATSSGKQQFADHSTVNRVFTIDYQPGFEILGHLAPGSRGDSWYFAGIFTGTGRANGFDDDGHPMYMARYQWNFLGRDPGFSSSDVEYHDKPAASLAVGGVTNQSRYTRFSSSGGGELDGFEPGAPGQYSIKQAMGEFFLKYRGISVQHESHWKRIHDNINLTTTDLRGAYVQAGYFPHSVVRWVPRQWEFAYRYAYVDPNTGRPADLRQEHTVVFNWFFEGHDNKLTLEAGRLSLARPGRPDRSEFRYRVQWDVQF